MNKRKSGLGRGLSSLIPNGQTKPSYSLTGGLPTKPIMANLSRADHKSDSGQEWMGEVNPDLEQRGSGAVQIKDSLEVGNSSVLSTGNSSVLAGKDGKAKEQTVQKNVGTDNTSRPSDLFFASGGSGSVERGGSVKDLLMPRKENVKKSKLDTAKEGNKDSIRHAAQAAAKLGRFGKNTSNPTGKVKDSNDPVAMDTERTNTDANGKSRLSSEAKKQHRKGTAQKGSTSTRTPKTAIVSRETIADSISDPVELVPVPGVTLTMLSPDEIVPNPKQPRTIFDEDELEELAASLKEVGVLQPVVVRTSQLVPGKFELIMGERRWRASQLAQLNELPAIVRETADDDLLRDALLENLHRVALNPLEEAAAYQQLMEEFGCTQAQLAVKIARSRAQIANTVRLLRLPASIQTRVAAGVLSAGHARAILALSNPEDQEYLAKRIVAEGLSVRVVEEIVSLGNVKGTPRKRTTESKGRGVALPDHYQDAIEHWSESLDTRVTIRPGKKSSKLLIEFVDDDDLERLTKLLSYLPKID